MRKLFKNLSEMTGAMTLIVLIGGAGSTIAITLIGKASVARVEALENRTNADETRISAGEVHHLDDDRLIDWLVQSTWVQHPDLPPPPPRRVPVK